MSYAAAYEEKYGRGSYVGSRPSGSSRDNSAIASVSRKRGRSQISVGFGDSEASGSRQKLMPVFGPFDTRPGTNAPVSFCQES